MVEPGKKPSFAAAAGSGFGRQFEIAGEVGADAAHPETGVAGGDILDHEAQMLRRYVDGRILGRVFKRIEQQIDLGRRAAAVFDDHRAGTREAPDIIASIGQQADLRPGDVILLGPANAVENVRALLVVEELRRNFLLRGPQAGDHRVLEIGHPGLPVDEIGHASGRAVAGWCQIIHDAVAAFRCPEARVKVAGLLAAGHRVSTPPPGKAPVFEQVSGSCRQASPGAPGRPRAAPPARPGPEGR